jgi:hypothetical protein
VPENVAFSAEVEMRATIRPMFLTLAGLLVSGVWSTSGAQAPAACALLTKPEIAEIVGRPVYSDPDQTSLAGGAGSSCTYDGGEAQIIVFSGPKSQELWNDLAKRYGRDKETKHPVPAAGEGAYVIYPKPRNEYEDTIGMLVVSSGNNTLGISIAAAKGEAVEAVQPKLVRLTKAVVARLR